VETTGQREEADPGGDQAEVGQGEGAAEVAPSAAAADEETDEEELSDRQRWILETMLANEITSYRRRKKRADVVLLINRTHNSDTYGRDFAALGKRGYLEAREGPKGGVWLTQAGKAEAERLRSSS
jgi:hypothetical protein